MRRRLRVGSVVLVAGVLALLASACVMNGTWAVAPPPIDPSPPSTETSMIDVSCTSPTHCLAIGIDATPANGLVNTPMVQRWDGVAWTMLAHPTGPAGATWIRLNMISCGTPTSCVVTYSAQVASSSSQRFARWDGSAWHDLPLEGQAGRTNAVDCTATGACVLTARNRGAGTWDGTTFTSHPGRMPDITSLSCTAIDHCVGLSVRDDQTSYLWDGSSITDAPGPPMAPADHTSWMGIECVAADSCLAVGQTEPELGEGGVMVSAQWDGTSWTSVPLPFGEGTLGDLSCGSTFECLAIGSAYDDEGGPQPAVLAWNGQDWYPAPPHPAGASAALSCTPQQWCLAVGVTGPPPSTPGAATYAWTNAT